MKTYKKLMIFLVMAALFIPILNVNHFNGKTIETRKCSMVGLIIQDIKDGTIGTRF